MTHIVHHGRTRSGSPLSRTFALAAELPLRLLARLGRLIAAEMDRRETMKLLGADAQMLSDIGITRADVQAAVMTGTGRKASEHLDRLRCERRRAERAQAGEARRQA